MKVWQLKGVKSLESVSNSGDEPNYKPEIPSESYIKARITIASLTASDISNYLGRNTLRLPIIPCRNAVALVSESSDESFKTGQRIFLSPYHNINNNIYKTRGLDIDGYLADYKYVPIADVFTLPEGVKDDDVVYIEDIALAINALEKIDLQKGEYILLYGASYINQIIAQLAIYYQSIPIVVDKDNDLLDVAESNGIYYTVNTTEEILSQKIIEITAGKMIDHLIFDTDCFTNIDEFTEFIKLGGNICLVGFNKSPDAIMCNLQRIIAKELTILSVNDGYSSLPSAINMIANKIINTKDLFGESVDFDNVKTAMVDLSGKINYKKTVVKC